MKTVPAASSEPAAVEVFDRLLIWFSPFAFAAIAFGWPTEGALSSWLVHTIHLALLIVGLAVALARRRLGARVRLLTYSGCFLCAGAVETLATGAAGAGLLLSFLAVLLAAVSRNAAIRWSVLTLIALTHGAAALWHGRGWFAGGAGGPSAASPWAAVSGLLLLAFACGTVAFWRRLGERLYRTDEKLRVAEGHFRMLFDMAGDATVLLEGSRVVETNLQAQTAFGFSEAEFKAIDWSQVSPERQANGANSIDEGRRLMGAAHEGPQHFRWMHRRKDGRVFEAEVSLSSALHGNRRIHLAIVRDLSDYRIVERENRLLATALNHAGEAVEITDSRGNIAYVNRAFEEITGYSRHEVHGQNPRLLKSGRHENAFYQELWATITSGRAWRGRLQNRRKDGVIYTENCCITPLRDERGTICHFVAVKRDISHELELEDQLVQSRKMEAVGRLAGGIAHDFNNILQVITGNVAMAGMDAPPGHPVHGSLDEIARASERAVNLVQQLLAFSRREALKLRPVEINALITDTTRMLRRLIGEDIVLSVPPATRPLNVMGDPVRIDQVLLNLCVNARDAMPDGGRLTIETEVVEIDRSYCQGHPDAKPGTYVCVAVSDDGAGIPKEIQHRIFEPFFSTKEVGRGTGLGLATVYAIVRQHGGFINLYSEIGLGTTFRFYLPTAPVTLPTEAPPAEATSDPLHGRGETILVAEDDEQVLAIAHRVLVQSGYKVLTARHGDEALAVHAAHGGPIHLAILDVVMPRRNGRLTHDELRRRCPSLPVLFATGYSYHHLQDGLIEQSQVLRKPFTPRELLGRVRSMLDEPATEALAGATDLR